MGLRLHSYIFVSMIHIFDLSLLSYGTTYNSQKIITNIFSKSSHETMPKALMKINQTLTIIFI